jgi:uncharacterized membrane protein
MVRARLRHMAEYMNDGRGNQARQRDVRRQFGAWLLPGLEFASAADLMRSAMSSSWADIGQLASIAVIRTALNYFLEAEVDILSLTADEVRDA